MPLFPVCVHNNHDEDVLSILKLCKPYIDDINKIDTRGRSILYYCVYYHNTILVEWLVDNGVDINIATKCDYTCIGIGICIILAYGCIPEIAKLYIQILECILSRLPTIECIKSTVENIKRCYYVYIYNKSLIEMCIRYFILVNYKYTCDTYSSYIEYITECKKKLLICVKLK
ncbi:ankyrin-like protein [Variola virus]|uniref:Ankyrin-like protein n=1 Tax=Variola virus TaxID=10255 RepID=Q0NBR3_VARV|nr:ankyrin-like protein [Variola virus]ABF24776.1 ankyrin-like protein [Variola virus]ABF26993.1 ankyrin-like protein [Variola virus]UXO30881.1 ankyrin-like protein [Variola virus]